jgi:hypothetical protein
VNQTYHEYEMIYPEEVRSDLIEDWIPENYFCKFFEKLDENIRWQIYFYRYNSLLNSE